MLIYTYGRVMVCRNRSALRNFCCDGAELCESGFSSEYSLDNGVPVFLSPSEGYVTCWLQLFYRDSQRLLAATSEPMEMQILWMLLNGFSCHKKAQYHLYQIEDGLSLHPLVVQ